MPSATILAVTLLIIYNKLENNKHATNTPNRLCSCKNLANYFDETMALFAQLIALK
jgi:hypothetical protein